MPTTPNGHPYFQDPLDPPAGGSQSQAMMQSVDDWETANVVPGSSVLVGRTTNLNVTSSTPTSPASFDLGVLFQRGTGVIYQGSGIIQILKPGLWHWHATTNWPDTTLVHRRKVSVQVNGTNFGIGARSAWIFGAATGEPDTAGGLLPITQANVDAGGAVSLQIYQSSTANMLVVPASFGVYRIG